MLSSLSFSSRTYQILTSVAAARWAATTLARVRNIWIRRAESMMRPGEEIWVTRHEEEAIRRTSTLTQMAIKALLKPKKKRLGIRLFPSTTTNGGRSSQKKKPSDFRSISPGISLLTLPLMHPKHWIAKYTLLHSRNKRSWTSTSRKTSKKVTFIHQNLSTRHPSSLWARKMGSYGLWWTTGSSIHSWCQIDFPSLWSKN